MLERIPGSLERTYYFPGIQIAKTTLQIRLSPRPKQPSGTFRRFRRKKAKEDNSSSRNLYTQGRVRPFDRNPCPSLGGFIGDLIEKLSLRPDLWNLRP
ncbi:Hypothetical protein NTJ_07017 [Nesidiocoris tenuis]|uniref:Uncharacterized protein n=1 Tax=Nesidiocoris tenuis TaxID=355587 RepID=A0ABN7AQG1_9HEMI|nr:Hypothetical protein NTJ_07017 [Nesidiocoris tenuis]